MGGLPRQGSRERRCCGPCDSMSAESAKPVADIRNTDMPEEMQKFAITAAQKAYDTHKNGKESEIASSIKKEMDQKFGSAWHVIVGRNFGSHVIHEGGSF